MKKIYLINIKNSFRIFFFKAFEAIVIKECNYEIYKVMGGESLKDIESFNCFMS